MIKMLFHFVEKIKISRRKKSAESYAYQYIHKILRGLRRTNDPECRCKSGIYLLSQKTSLLCMDASIFCFEVSSDLYLDPIESIKNILRENLNSKNV